MNITIIAAALPPQLDGIGDYTACLAAELTRSVSVTILTGAPMPDPIPGVRIETVFSANTPASVQGIADFVKTNPPDWVLLQYQPFSYGKWGRNLHLPRVMAQIKRDCPQTRFALMVHEPFVPFTSWQFAIMATWQRWQLWRLGQTADVVFFSIDPWVTRFQHWFPGKLVVHLPVGSNIPCVPMSRQEARTRLGIGEETVVLGLFGTAHVSRLLEPVRDAAEAVHQAGYNVQVLYIGPQSGAIREAMGEIPVVSDGPLPAKEVSLRFPAMDVYFTVYDDGISTRRGALMAGLQHGAAIVGTCGSLTDTVLKSQHDKAFLLADVKTLNKLNAHVLGLIKNQDLHDRLGKNAQQLYETEFAWPQIADRLLKTLAEIKPPAETVFSAGAS